MKVYFCSLLFNDIEENIKKSQVSMPVSGHLYQMSLIDGLLKNNVECTILNTRRVNRYPLYQEKKFIHTSFIINGKDLGVNIPFNNRRIINFFSKVYSLRKELCSLLMNDVEEECIVMVYNTPITILLAVLLTKIRYKNLHLCASIGDIPGKFGTTVKVTGVKRLKLNLINCIERKLITKFNSFVFVTEQMADALRVKTKPHVVVECLYKPDEDKEIQETSVLNIDFTYSVNSKIVFYAGGINVDYGIKHMLESFALIEDDTYIFIIAGDGNAVDLVKDYAMKDIRIHYLGLVAPETVSAIEKIATVIINPRTSDKEFVRYSFPSKTFVSLSSGVPFIAHRLPCYPKEYDEYIQFPKDESDEALKDKIVEICEMPKSQRNIIGSRGIQFIRQSKSHIELTKKIIDMWKLYVQ